MNKKVIMGFAAGIVVVLVALFALAGDDEPAKKPAAKPPAAQTPAAKPAAPAPAAAKPAAPAPQAVAKNYSKIITAEDLKNITGTAYKMDYVNRKLNGEPDFTFSTTDEGHVILTVTVLSGSSYDTNYNKFASQDYKAMEYAFWGPKNTNQPKILGFRKGDTTIVLVRTPDAGMYPINIEMMEKIARSIAARL